MWKIERFVTYFAVLALFMGLGACKDDETFLQSNIQIVFPVSELNIDLNTINNPPILSVVNSVNRLRSVEIFILKDEVIEKYGNTITEFANPQSYTVYESIIYSGDMTGVRIVATDAAGAVEQKELPFNVKQMVGAPEIVFTPESIEMNEGDTPPLFTIAVKAQSPLTKISIFKIVSGVQTPAEDPIEDFPTPQEYTITSDNLNLPNIFVPGITSIKVEAEDEYGKIKIATMPVTFHELPAPTVVFDQTELIGTEGGELTVSGTITASFPLVKAVLTLKGKDATISDKELETFTYDSEQKSAHFTHTIASLSTDYNAIEIMAFDVMDKSVVETKSLITIPLPSPVIGIPDGVDYRGIEVGMTIPLSDYPATTDGDMLDKFEVTAVAVSGIETTIEEISDINATSYTSTKTISATTDLRKIVIKATNRNGKEARVVVPVSVGCWILDNIVMQEQIESGNANGASQLCVFSAVQRKALSLADAFAAQADCDFSFYVASATSDSPQLRISKLGNSSLSSKYAHSTYSIYKKWEVKNPILMAAKSHSTTVARDEFFVALTPEEVKGWTIDKNANHQSINKNLTELVFFETTTRNGKVQRGVIRAEGVLEEDGTLTPALPANTPPAYKIKMTVFLTTPY